MNQIAKKEGAARRSPDLPESKERIFLRLSDSWALGYDRNQWMVCRKRTRGGGTSWTPGSFIGGKLAGLVRVIDEKGITPTPEASAALARFPDTFRKWLHERNQQDVA